MSLVENEEGTPDAPGAVIAPVETLFRPERIQTDGFEGSGEIIGRVKGGSPAGGAYRKYQPHERTRSCPIFPANRHFRKITNGSAPPPRGKIGVSDYAQNALLGDLTYVELAFRGRHL